jgi:hypothetical protein
MNDEKNDFSLHRSAIYIISSPEMGEVKKIHPHKSINSFTGKKYLCKVEAPQAR